MASRLAKSALGASRVRPVLSTKVLPALCPVSSTRFASSVPVEDPKTKAQSIIDALPGNSLVSKTAILSGGAGLAIAAISNELYILNEETVAAFCLLSVFTAVFKMAGPLHKQWAQGQIQKQKDILYAARADHANAVTQRIENVKPLSEVVSVTKQLFEVSKETARLEAQAFELEQRTALAAEAKRVLDSWVQYEGQVKQREQRELAETVMAKIQKELENPKLLQQILQQSVADVERIVSSKAQ
ncbi:atp4 subunit B of the stator stalk of mitochondrial F1F0 ATP synthase [Ophidiomyces ophidiicola]|uniref:Atp4 subunit B of the stator stalk of mitochondrial F1F0 ATP synthase n=1 Tax=Ophidiomyces ophidiicola TaxID=1387563 RepID=A0ACB8UT58_9EURO|nr:atp4 subunit B of the stator stalk of mitochondrial F1F0 ATP synthase [Ophidiomyces ophidiicola]KAI1906838.1 atp4 subunit B of the stator stalk of mitochondrial F1F0 ATP synthase [Ophidiomyces ophidiicola]KAI1907607.1 atp4 subunit B of the stator stalk of mitochondrial F1F0 ATP synthase [Ophidiomyces ophidiicola]KAI1919147.1 atp4 subunit B of the stator stalk of mitochondrial F1F0 ATP synthase [Ophidiomyces ophidiicola]KAI1922869.1 atp4 subunit B of the stator stalk of mitochondrial F1F0 ATP